MLKTYNKNTQNGGSQIWLQQVGWQPAIKAKNLKPGMVTIWDYGATQTIKSVLLSDTKDTITCAITSVSGHVGSCTFRADQLVGVLSQS